MRNLSIAHHDIQVSLVPEDHFLRASDRIQLEGDSPSLSLYLGNRFTWIGIRQGQRLLRIELEEEGQIANRYRVLEWAPDGPGITAAWEGTVDRFKGYGVSIIRSDLVEMSGFCNWFPTVEPQSQLEAFTYDLGIHLPPGWTIVTPGVELNPSGGYRRYRYDRPIEDILLCASTRFRVEAAKGGSEAAGLTMNFPPWPDEDVAPFVDDFVWIAELCEEWFGPMVPGSGGVAVISPRGPGSAEWGYERDGMWVVGDLFARYLLDNDWVVQGLHKSLAAHETIHAWFGVGVEFTEPWLAEALTQYLEVIATADRFQESDLPGKYFRWYAERAREQLVKEDRAICDWQVNEDTYVYWYLKGSWAFWDLEARIGRENLLKGVARVYVKYVGRVISYAEFVREMGALTSDILDDHFRHWFRETGFEPRYR